MGKKKSVLQDKQGELMIRKRREEQENTVDLHSMSKPLFVARNDEQKEMLRTIHNNTITFIKGRAGTGKTFIAIAYAIQQLLHNKCKRVILTRPVIEAAGEKLGYLPGSLYEKIDPYLLPIFSNALKVIDAESLKKLTNRNGHDALVQALPLAYMRGVTFDDAIVVADESQNTIPKQMRMLLTRLGENSKIIVCGDVTQSDISGRNGLEDAFELFQGVENIGFVSMSIDSIVRSPLVKLIEERYDASDCKNQRTKTV